MVMMPDVAQFMGDNVLKQRLRSHDDSPIKPDPCVGPAATPSGLHLADFNRFDGDAEPLGEPVHCGMNLLRCSFAIPVHESLLNGMAATLCIPATCDGHNKTAACHRGSDVLGGSRPLPNLQLVLATKIAEGFAADAFLGQVPAIPTESFLLPHNPLGLVSYLLGNQRLPGALGSGNRHRHIGSNSYRDWLSGGRSFYRVLDSRCAEDNRVRLAHDNRTRARSITAVVTASMSSVGKSASRNCRLTFRRISRCTSSFCAQSITASCFKASNTASDNSASFAVPSADGLAMCFLRSPA